MKNIFILLTCIVLFSSCVDQEYTSKPEISVVNTKTNELYEVVEIDSCEYIVFNALGTSSWESHKGNCKYCKQRKQ